MASVPKPQAFAFSSSLALHTDFPGPALQSLFALNIFKFEKAPFLAYRQKLSHFLEFQKIKSCQFVPCFN